MKKILVLIFILVCLFFLSSCTFNRYYMDDQESNYYSNSGNDGRVMKYNADTGEFHYQNKSDVLKYNPDSGNFQYAPKDSRLKYNPFTGNLEY